MKNLLKINTCLLAIVLCAISFTACSRDDDPAPEKEKQADVYVAGTESSATGVIAKLWKNGVATNLSDGSSQVYTNSIYVSGKDVYAVGEVADVVKVWKNGVETDLTDGTNFAYAFGVFVVEK